MAWIYKIVNNINGKVYIGKTEYNNPEKRWREHSFEASQERSKDRPLYKAIRKYGINNFSFEPIEETLTPNEREIFYIRLYNSYIGFENSNGYNATLGGDGKRYLQFSDEEIISFFKTEAKEVLIKTAKHFKIHPETVSKILKNHSIEIPKGWYGSHVSKMKKVLKIDKKTNQVLQEYNSVTEAAKELGKGTSHITEVCNGKHLTAYGYIWRYKCEDDEEV